MLGDLVGDAVAKVKPLRRAANRTDEEEKCLETKAAPRVAGRLAERVNARKEDKAKVDEDNMLVAV